MSVRIAFTGADIFDGQTRHQHAALIIKGGCVEAIVPRERLDPECEIVNLNGGLIAAGFVDLQVNGGGGRMLNNTPDVETIRTICDAHAKSGTTSLLPTLITDTPAQTSAAIKAAHMALEQGIAGMAGLHLEGPHLSLARKGAHDAKLIRPMSEDDCRELEVLAKALPSLLLTIAPESVTPAQIERLSTAGAIVSLGHSDCSFEDAVRAAQSGARCATHLFNAMSQIANREAGLVGAVLETGEMYAGLIADGFHVDPASIRIALRAKQGPGHIFLVSDSMATTGSAIKEFILNDRHIISRNGKLTLSDGTLAGAELNLEMAVQFAVETIGLPQDEALRMATLYPAKLLGRETEIGCLAPGTNADFNWLNDALMVQRTWRNGQICHLGP